MQEHATKREKIFEKIGSPGRYQVFIFLFSTGCQILVFLNHICMVFFAAKTKHHCKLDESQYDARIPILTRNNQPVWDGCHFYVGNNTTLTPCNNGWKYYLDDRETTIISEFDLVCDDAYKSDLAITIYFAGVLVGAFFSGVPADKYGRKLVLLLLLLTNGTVGMVLYFFANTYTKFAICRFFIGLSMQGIFNTAYILALEFCQTRYRATVAMSMGASTTLGAVSFGILAYLIRNWRHLQLIMAIIPFTQLILLSFIPESLRWLLMKNKFRQAEIVIKRIVHVNGLSFPCKSYDDLKLHKTEDKCGNLTNKQPKTSIIDLLKFRTLRNRTFILITAWCTSSASFYCMLFNISALFGNKYLNFCVSVSIDLIMVLLSVWIVPRFGRRRPLGLSFLLCSIANFVCLVTKTVNSDRRSVLVFETAIALLGKTCALSTLNVLYTFTTELYPTIVRSVGLSLTAVANRFGGMIAPQILFLGIYTNDSVPYAIIGVMTLICTAFAFILPETHNVTLADTIAEIDLISGSSPPGEVVSERGSKVVFRCETTYESNV